MVCCTSIIQRVAALRFSPLSHAIVSFCSTSKAAADPFVCCMTPSTSSSLQVSVSLSVDVASSSGEYSWGTLAARPHGYGCQSATCQELATGGRVAYYTFSPAAVSFAAGTKEGAPMTAAPAKGGEADAPLRPASPATVLRSTLRHMPSFSSLPSDSDYDVASTSSGDENEVGSRLAAALRQLGRSRSRSGSLSPKSSIGAASEQGDVGAAGACAACKGSGVAACAAPVAAAAAVL